MISDIVKTKLLDSVFSLKQRLRTLKNAERIPIPGDFEEFKDEIRLNLEVLQNLNKDQIDDETKQNLILIFEDVLDDVHPDAPFVYKELIEQMEKKLDNAEAYFG